METAKACACDICSESFPSKMKLFKHLEVAHGYENPRSKPEKIVVLFGWLSTCLHDVDTWVKDAPTNIASDVQTFEIELALFRSMYAVDNKLASLEEVPPEVGATRPQGFTRASGCSTRTVYAIGMEPTNHSVCDVVCMNASKRWAGTEVEWLEAVNAFLPSNIRVLARIAMPSNASDFNAECGCTQRRYECLLPMDVVMPPELAVAPAAPIVRKRIVRASQANSKKKSQVTSNSESAAQAEGDDVDDEETSRDGEKEGEGEGEAARAEGPAVESEEVTDCVKEWESKQPWTEMDLDFPTDTAEGQIRIEYFRGLKKLLKQFAGRHSLHNFATGGACPDDASAKRRIDRIYHKDILTLPDGSNWVVISMSGDAFLRGQVRRLMGLILGIQRSLLPEGYFEAVLNPDIIAELPTVPGHLCYLAECRFSFFEARYQGTLVLDPRRVAALAPTWGPTDTAALEAWRSTVQRHITSVFDSETSSMRTAWLKSFEDQCKDVCVRHSALASLRDRVLPTLHGGEGAADLARRLSLSAVPAVYQKVLRLLQAVDYSGSWPLSSTLRQKVIQDSSLVENGGVGGSFSVGKMPKPFPDPKGNTLFPELMLACFELEHLLLPHRPPSSTIAINKHAQFRPHRDSGAGNGQCVSLIVGLGDYVGGETVVECEAHDIRYQPLEFDGWSSRHYTLPFVGERYSLVWFTPFGIAQEDLFWWNWNSDGTRTIKSEL